MAPSPLFPLGLCLLLLLLAQRPPAAAAPAPPRSTATKPAVSPVCAATAKAKNNLPACASLEAGICDTVTTKCPGLCSHVNDHCGAPTGAGVDPQPPPLYLGILTRVIPPGAGAIDGGCGSEISSSSSDEAKAQITFECTFSVVAGAGRLRTQVYCPEGYAVLHGACGDAKAYPMAAPIDNYMRTSSCQLVAPAQGTEGWAPFHRVGCTRVAPAS